MANREKFDDKVLPGPAIRNAKKHPDKVYMISRFDEKGRKTPDQLHQITWGQADRMIRDFTKGLAELGFKPFDRLGVFGPNRPRWIIACMAAIFSRGVHVPLYPNSKEEDVWWILQDSGARFVVCGSMKQAEKALAVKARVETLEKIIVMDPLPEKHDPMIMGFEEVLELGKKSKTTDQDQDQFIAQIEENDLAAIIYTSGTTGRPKGVMLTHKNFVAQRAIEDEFDYTEEEVFFAHLPMCHSFGFSSDLLNAGNIGGTLFVADSVETDEMRKNLKDCRPTVMSSVPRLWEKLYIQIGQTVASKPPTVRKLFKWASSVGEQSFRLQKANSPVPFTLKLQAKLAKRIFDKVKNEIGLNRLKYSYTGGGPIDSKLIYFFGGMGISLFQGFGLTETAPIINASTPEHNKIGAVGRALPNVEMKIAADGEILIRGPQVMKGYYNNPEATAEVMTPDGFFCTGDIGEIDADGFLKITDRKKELLKTSGGKYVAPQPIENEFNTDPYVEAAAVVGDGRKYVCALIVPEFENVKKWLAEQGIALSATKEISEHPKVKELIEQRVAQVNQRLARYEQIKKFAILPEPFSELTGELTPSLKKKRRVIETKYKHLIDAMYPPD